MALQSGTRIGVYEIVGAVGAGGMGEVYRARDSKLHRDVAIKALPAALAADPERVARFEREAQLLAAINHPHIATIHGFVEERGSTFLVLELVEGSSLAQRLTGGALGVPESFAIARQIADALQAAHLKGIIHRDLKPANVMVTPGGRVKVLDFGLAKTLEEAAPSEQTFTSPVITQAGVVLGTAAYMAPEQAKGYAADRRTDIWAFGCVLYEMLTGRAPFGGEAATEVVAAVLRGEPDWAALPSTVSPVLTLFLRRCLAKNPNDRVQDIGDMRLALEGAFDPAGAASPAARRPFPRWAWIATVPAVAGMAAVAAWTLKPVANVPHPLRRYTVASASAPLAVANTNRDFALSPDGTRVVYFSGATGNRKMFVRALDSLDATLLRDDTRYFEAVISPDSRWVAFNDEVDFTLRKMAISGGPPIAIAPIGFQMLGAAWGDDGTIVYATNEGLWRVSESGGTPQRLTTTNAQQQEAAHAWPEFLPGGRTLLFTIRYKGASGSAVAALDLRSGQWTKVVDRGTSPRFAPSGHLIYVSEGTLTAVRFDPGNLRVSGQPQPLAEGILMKASGGANFSISADGTLAYVSNAYGAAARRLTWIDRKGGSADVGAPARPYAVARISPDGTRIALDVRDADSEIWVWDIARRTLSRVTSHPAADVYPLWSRDGRRLLFGSAREGPFRVFMQSADGTGIAESLNPSNAWDAFPTSVSPDGSTLIVRREGTGGTGYSIYSMPMAPPWKEVELVTAANGGENGEVSPDGRWLAYESQQSGTLQVYVQPFPDVSAGRWQVSSGGGRQAAWAPDARELFYVADDGRLMAVPIGPGGVFQPGTPTVAIASPFVSALLVRSYDVARDGKRFLVIQEPPAAEIPAPSITVVLNWAEELRRAMPR